MPIEALNEATARAITSSLVLNDSTSAVKELIDNALDANATAVSIEISPNTLDFIQVRDNGSGIGIEDRQLLCKRGCTSKIRTIDDLHQLGGGFLGFRGEALSSIAELSERVVITTRVDGELVASALTFGHSERLLDCISASHPVGTSVRIHNFLKSIPVRKQTALKNSTKILVGLKRLVFSYAFARPQIRFSIKVIKGKNEKLNWTYAPNPPNSSLVETASKIEGVELANQCKQVCLYDDDTTSADEGLGWQIVALLLTAETDLEKLSTSQQYISVDGRPIEAERGIMKVISKLYRSYLDHAMQSINGSLTIAKPFFCIKITCPPESYDVNIEPSKSEVLFNTRDHVLHLFQMLFVKAYGGNLLNPTQRPSKVSVKLSENDSNLSFDLLLAKKGESSSQIQTEMVANSFEAMIDGSSAMQPQTILLSKKPSVPIESPNHLHIASPCEEVPKISISEKKPLDLQAVYKNMYNVDDSSDVNNGNVFHDNDLVPQVEDEDNEQSFRAVTNPWSLAKLNAPIRSKQVNQNSGFESPTKTYPITPNRTKLVDGLSEESRSSSHRTPLGLTTESLTPDTLSQPKLPYQNPGPPMRRRGNDDDELTGHVSDDFNQSDLLTPTRTPLDRWVKAGDRSRQVRISAEEHNDQDRRSPAARPMIYAERFPGPPLKPFRRRNAQSSDSETSSESLFKAEGRNKRSKKSHGLQASADSLDSHHQLRSLEKKSSTVTYNSMSDPRHELEQIMDFEHRKRAAIIQQRDRSIRKPAMSHDYKRPNDGQFETRLALTSMQGHQALGVIEDMDARFGGPRSFLTPEVSKTKPHHNGSSVAIRKSDTSLSNNHLDTKETEQGRQSQVQSAISKSISKDDPRAYFMAFQNRHKDIKAMNGSGVKISQTQLRRLPLETVFNSVATYNQVANLRFELNFKDSFFMTAKSDSYVQTGNNEYQSWQVYCKQIDDWDHILQNLIRENFRVRMGDLEVVPAVKLSLNLAIKAHIDNAESTKTWYIGG